MPAVPCQVNLFAIIQPSVNYFLTMLLHRLILCRLLLVFFSKEVMTHAANVFFFHELDDPCKHFIIQQPGNDQRPSFFSLHVHFSFPVTQNKISLM